MRKWRQNPVHLFALRSEQQIEREQFSRRKQAERYLEFLKGYLIPKIRRIYRQGRSKRPISNLYLEYGQNILIVT